MIRSIGCSRRVERFAAHVGDCVGLRSPSFQRHEHRQLSSGLPGCPWPTVTGDGAPMLLPCPPSPTGSIGFENPTFRRWPVATRIEKYRSGPAGYRRRRPRRDCTGQRVPLRRRQPRRPDPVAQMADRVDAPWQIHPIAVDPVVHRLRSGDVDGRRSARVDSCVHLRARLEGLAGHETRASVGLSRAARSGRGHGTVEDR